MKTLLICPSFRPAVPHLAEPSPLATAPILGACVVCHWIEHLAAIGAREIQIVAADRAEAVRSAVGDGARWGVRITMIVSGVEPTRGEAASRYRPKEEAGWLPPPLDVVSMSHLPGNPDLPLFESYASWFAALIAWMPRALTPARIRVAEARPGIWVGSRARVSPTAQLIAPCWIGDQVSVNAGAVVGPGAILEDRSVVESNASVTQSWVGPETFVGPMTSVANSLALGNTLIDWRTDSSLTVPDPFLLCSLSRLPSPATTGRLGAQGRHKPNLSVITALHARLDRGSNQELPG
jgi:NDP-sugar pyrophosphorylase family protein